MQRTEAGGVSLYREPLSVFSDSAQPLFGNGLLWWWRPLVPFVEEAQIFGGLMQSHNEASDEGNRVPAFSEHHLSRSQARKYLNRQQEAN